MCLPVGPESFVSKAIAKGPIQVLMASFSFLIAANFLPVSTLLTSCMQQNTSYYMQIYVAHTVFFEVMLSLQRGNLSDALTVRWLV